MWIRIWNLQNNTIRLGSATLAKPLDLNHYLCGHSTIYHLGIIPGVECNAGEILHLFLPVFNSVDSNPLLLSPDLVPVNDKGFVVVGDELQVF